ncbi:hypothetical protein [Leptolyngbya sp. BC1307]|uniref:hypothetical protein n=1 Tax=Leptolyngbya sp. BC1307 TaxID=2029589 RepID=UPI00197DC60F|nr:hypothetical protein [Leptolyngbya sp. BC1307]
MVTPLEKFRIRYPEGCLTADLVSMYDGQYVVRAAVMNQGATLATGLAASIDIQIAEDRARDRALAVLGILADNDALPSALANGATTSLPTAEAPSTPPTDEEFSEIEQPEEDMGPPIDAIEESPVTPAQPSAAAIALENFNASALPVDLSDVIAQTDVELRRLGWTSVQGREYLEKTYGKRSRTQLTDEELMSFLLYLEEQ